MIDKNSADYVVLKCAVKHFGEEKQLRKLQEELCELAAEIGKFLDGRSSIENVCNEIADVKITIEYPDIIYGKIVDEIVKNQIRIKINRLDHRIIRDRIENNSEAER
jgi:hypothetical protein